MTVTYTLTDERVCWDRRDNTYAMPKKAEYYVPACFTTEDREECEDACEANVKCTFYNFLKVNGFRHCYNFEHVGIGSYGTSTLPPSGEIHTGGKIPWRRESNTNAIWGPC